MMYRAKTSQIALQAVVALFMLSGAFMLTGTFMRIILAVFALLLLKDVFTSYKRFVKLDEDGISEWIGSECRWEIPWTKMELLTRTKKHPKWLVLSDGENFRMIKASLQDFDSLVKETVRYSVLNSKIGMHDSVVQQSGFPLELDEEGRVKSASRQRFIDQYK